MVRIRCAKLNKSCSYQSVKVNMRILNKSRCRVAPGKRFAAKPLDGLRLSDLEVGGEYSAFMCLPDPRQLGAEDDRYNSRFNCLHMEIAFRLDGVRVRTSPNTPGQLNTMLCFDEKADEFAHAWWLGLTPAPLEGEERFSHYGRVIKAK